MFTIDGIEPQTIPLAVIAICLTVLAAILLKFFWWDNKFLTRRERKVIESKHSKVIDLYGYVPKAAKK